MPATKKTTSSSRESRASSKTSGPSSSRMDAIKLLTQDHKEVKKLFDDYDKLVKGDAEANEREALAQEICGMLTLHATIEEELFYPQAREALGDNEDLIDEATVEHASAKELIAQIEDSSPEDDLYDAKVKVLSEYIQHHVKEEEGEIFPKIKKADLDLMALGEEMAQRKEALQSSFAR